ncbi:MAG: hypothetical protein ACI85V_002457, partial [bacterium]
HAVVKVIKHLCDKVFVVEFGQDNIVFVGHESSLR